MGRILPLTKLAALAVAIAFACGCLSPASAKDKLITGVIVGFECGESPGLILQDADGKKHYGNCYEEWCEKAAWEARWCPTPLEVEETDVVSRQWLGKKIRAKVRRIMIEEPGPGYDGVYADEFFNIEVVSSAEARADSKKSRPRKSAQDDKWSFWRSDAAAHDPLTCN